MKRGILLIGAGHPNYGKMAAALAATLKQADPLVPIHLAYAGDALINLSEGETSLFDSMAEIPEHFYRHKGKEAYIKTKVHMYDLSPFDQTIFLDVDMLWLTTPPAALFDEMEGSDVSFSNFNTVQKYSQWADIEEVKKLYPAPETGKYYSMHSELMYFTKSATAKKFFRKARTIYDTLKVKSTTFAGAIPDELPLSIAAMVLDIHPHKVPFRPVYWMNAEGRYLHSYKLVKDYIAISMGGSWNPRFAVDQYNILSSAAYRKAGLQHPYRWKSKKSFLPERKTV